jgi:hypothetical protein
MKENLKVVDFNSKKPTKEELKTITNLQVWSQLFEFTETYGKDNKIVGGMVILRTEDDVSSLAVNMSGDELISSMEEVKHRYYFNKYLEME